MYLFSRSMFLKGPPHADRSEVLSSACPGRILPDRSHGPVSSCTTGDEPVQVVPPEDTTEAITHVTTALRPEIFVPA